MNNLTDLKDAVAAMHECDCSHVSTAKVREVFEHEVAWQGEVEVFELTGHPKAETAYAWSYEDDDGEMQYVAVLKIPPVETPSDAVRAAIASGRLN